MDTQLKNTIRQLSDLQDKAQELDEMLKDVRARINDIIWDLVDMRKSKKTHEQRKGI